MYGEKKIGVVTTSRADFGIYQPLIRSLNDLPNVDVELIALGAHFFKNQGNTIEEVRKFDHLVIHEIPGLTESTDLLDISNNFSLVIQTMGEFWKDHLYFDIVFVLGDRYEMAAAVLAGVPFSIHFAHLHGGEVTLGATDQLYRDTISLASKMHFTATERAKERVLSLLAPFTDRKVFCTGSVVLNTISTTVDLSAEEFFQQFGFDIHQNFVLVTIHPETMYLHQSDSQLREFVAALDWILNCTQDAILITLPNADAGASPWREAFLKLSQEFERVRCYENLGVIGYYTAMRSCSYMLGNSSSGIIESATAKAWSINVGDRQLGREQSANTFSVPFASDKIIEQIQKLPDVKYTGDNVYGNGDAVAKIVAFVLERWREI